MLQVCLSGYCIYFTHTLHVFHLDVPYDCNGFQVFSGVLFTCFRSMFKVFQQASDVRWSVVFGCFKSRLGIASILPTFCCIISPDGGRVSIRCRGQVLPNRRRRAPFPSCRLGGTGPAWSMKRSTARGRPNAGDCSDVRTLATKARLVGPYRTEPILFHQLANPVSYVRTNPVPSIGQSGSFNWPCHSHLLHKTDHCDWTSNFHHKEQHRWSEEGAD
jgi:hypothetical protein